MAEIAVMTRMEITVTSVLLTRPYQKRWSGRDSTLWMLSKVGGIGRPIGFETISEPFLNTLTSTR